MVSRFWSRLWWNLAKPEYVFRPAQILHRLKTRVTAPRDVETVRLPWGLNLRVRPAELVSRSIWRKGVYDIVMSEVVWRLLSEGELAVDVGANIGYVTSLMAARVGTGGSVMAYEAHPALVQELRSNAAEWPGVGGVVGVYGIALSNMSGPGFMRIPADWERNQGGASVAPAMANSISDGSVLCPAQFGRLDDFVSEGTFVGLAKIDVEGHEEAVLRGAERLLGRHGIRDIVFEDHGRYPTSTMSLLERYGYSVFSLVKRLLGPVLGHPSRAGVAPWNDRNYLATSDATRAAERLGAKGWHVLRRR